MTKINSNKSSARQRFKAVTGSVIIFTALTILGALAFLTVRSDVTRYAEMAEKSAVGLVVNHLELSDFTYKKLAIAAVRVLKNQTLALGPPQVRENIQVDGKVVSALQFGEVPAAGNFKMVDQVAGLMGCTATIFARDGEGFIRIVTNVKKPDGSRAVGTHLDPTGEAISAVQQGHAFYGLVKILGEPYFTAYEPITGEGGNIIGIWYAGYPIESLEALRFKVQNAHILSHGFTAVLDANNRLMFQSDNITPEICSALITGTIPNGNSNNWATAGYRMRKEVFKPWGFSIVSAIYQPDLSAETFTLVWKFLCFVMIIATLIIYFFYRFTSTISSISVVMGQLSNTNRELDATSSQLARSSQTLSSGASEQASSVEETSASLEEISSMIQATAENAQKAKLLASETRVVAERGSRTMIEMVEAMAAIDSTSAQVAKIVKNIDEIAFQTNILALNAAVEAARAGEAGAGFAVVADEVRSLAQRSAAAAKETADKIEAAIASSRKGSQCTARVGESLTQISEKVTATDLLVSEIATAANEQAQGIEQINQAVGQMDKVCQSNASSAEEIASAAEQVDTQGEVLNELVGRLQQLVGGDSNADPLVTPSEQSSRSRPAVVLYAQQGSKKPVRQSVDASMQIRSSPRKELPPGDPGDDQDFRNF